MLILVAVLLVTGCQQEEPAPHVHELVKIDEQASTCSQVGYKAYWTCSVCNEIFKDAAGTQLIVDITELTVATKAHEWKGEDCTSVDTCKNCDAAKLPDYAEHTAKADDGDCTTAVYCQNCTTVLVPAVDHISIPATCVAKAHCTVCGKDHGAVNPDGHSFANAIYLWSADFKKCTVAGSCELCNLEIYKTVATTYENGKAVAAFPVPAIGTITKDLTNPNKMPLDQYKAALTYMIENGETDIEVMFPALKNLSGPVYETFYSTATWYLEGAKIPSEVTEAVEAIMNLVSKLPL